MQLKPLIKSNISESRFDSSSPSMAKDSRGFSHISWFDEKNGHNSINYRFWDGAQWAEINESPIIYKTSDQIISSKYSLIIDNDDSIKVVFGRKKAIGSQVCISTHDNSKWTTAMFDVPYTIKWIGAIWNERVEDFSSSSSSSNIFSSSSSSVSSLSIGSSTSSSSISSLSNTSLSSDSTQSPSLTSTSSSETSYSSLSSSITSSSSSTSSSSYSSESSVSSFSSISSLSSRSSFSSSSSSSFSSDSFDSSSSTSSSSYLDNNIYVVIVSTDNNIYVVKYTTTLQTLSERTMNEFTRIDIGSCGNRVGVSTYGDSIYYDFYHPEEDSWSFPDWEKLDDTTDIVGFDVSMMNIDESVMIFGILDGYYDGTKIKLISADSNGNQYPYHGSTNEVSTIFKNGVTSMDFAVNCPRGICLTYDSSLENPLCVFLGGGKNILLLVSPESVNSYNIEIFGSPNSFSCVDGVVNVFNDTFSITCSSQSDIFYFDGVLGNQDFATFNPPNLLVLNNQRLKHGYIDNLIGEFIFTEFKCTWDNQTGDILREAKRRVVVTPDEGEDPDCNTSSSSLSDSSTSSSLTSESSDDLRCFLTWRAKYDCEEGLSVGLIYSADCVEYDASIPVGKWTEIDRVNGDYIMWEASNWFATNCKAGQLSSGSSWSHSTSSSSTSYTSESDFNDSCAVMYRNSYPKPLPSIPVDFTCFVSSSSSISSISSLTSPSSFSTPSTLTTLTTETSDGLPITTDPMPGP